MEQSNPGVSIGSGGSRKFSRAVVGSRESTASEEEMRQQPRGFARYKIIFSRTGWKGIRKNGRSRMARIHPQRLTKWLGRIFPRSQGNKKDLWDGAGLVEATRPTEGYLPKEDIDSDERIQLPCVGFIDSCPNQVYVGSSPQTVSTPPPENSTCYHPTPILSPPPLDHDTITEIFTTSPGSTILPVMGPIGALGNQSSPDTGVTIPPIEEGYSTSCQVAPQSQPGTTSGIGEDSEWTDPTVPIQLPVVEFEGTRSDQLRVNRPRQKDAEFPPSEVFTPGTFLGRSSPSGRSGTVSMNSDHTTSEVLQQPPLVVAGDYNIYLSAEPRPEDITASDSTFRPPCSRLDYGANGTIGDDSAGETVPPQPTVLLESIDDHKPGAGLPQADVSIYSPHCSTSYGHEHSSLSLSSENGSDSEYSDQLDALGDPTSNDVAALIAYLPQAIEEFFASELSEHLGTTTDNNQSGSGTPQLDFVSEFLSVELGGLTGQILGEVGSEWSDYTTTPRSTQSLIELDPEESIQIDVACEQRHTVFGSEIDEYRLETKFYHGYVAHEKHGHEDHVRLWERQTWKKEKIIGRGAFGDIWLEKRRGKQELRAVKTLHREILQKPGPSQELRALVKTKNYDYLFVKFFGWYEDANQTFFAMEYIEHGDLSKYIYSYTEKETTDIKEITRQILEGLEVLHRQRICHRDLKPQNILVASYDPIWVKITDFGISKEVKDTDLRTNCGTGGYSAPELLGILTKDILQSTSFSFALDIWSLGCMVHELLTQKTPFSQNTEQGSTIYSGVEQIPEKITADHSEEHSERPPSLTTDITLLMLFCKGETEFPTDALEQSHASQGDIAFVKSLLIPIPTNRPSATDVLKEDWLQGYKSSWLEGLKSEFSQLGVILDLGNGDVLARQTAKADIQRFLSAQEKQNIPSLLLKAITRGYKLATSKILESQAMDSLMKGKLFQLAIDQPDTVKELLQHNLYAGASIDNQTVLQWAVGVGRIEIVSPLLAHKPCAFPNSDCQKGFLLATKSGNKDMVELLLGHGVDTYSQENKITALEMAARDGHIEIVKLLLDNNSAVGDPADNCYHIALQASADGGHIGIVELLLSTGASLDPARLAIALGGAARSGNIELFKFLIGKGADMNARNGIAVKLAAANGHIDILKLSLDTKTSLDAGGLEAGMQGAAEGGHADILNLLIENGADINATREESLKLAAANGHKIIVQLLLEEASMDKGSLEISLRGAAGGGHSDIVGVLLLEGVNINAGGEETALQAAIKGGHINVVRLLLKNGADIDPYVEGPGGRTPLQAAAEGGYINIVKLLVDKGASVHTAAVKKGGRTALQAAAGGGHIDVAKFLLEKKADVNAAKADENGQTSLQAAVTSRNIDMVKLLLEHKADMNTGAKKSKGQTALQTAAGEGYTDIVNLLLDNDADVNAEGFETALEAAARGGYIDIVTLLLEYGADVNAAVEESSSRTALQAAAINGHIDIAKLLLGRGADVNTVAPNAKIRTALQAAISSGMVEMVKLLLDYRADVNIDHRNAGGRTALQYAANKGYSDIVKLLLEKGSDVNAAAAEVNGQTALQAAAAGGHIRIFKLLLNNGGDISSDVAVGENSRTALQAAAEGGHIEMVQFLLDNGADVNARAANFGGRTALQAALEGRHIDIADLLIQKGANINSPAAAHNGLTALQAVARHGDIDIVKLLLENGADVNSPAAPPEGQTALQAAARHGHIEIIKLLLANGANVNGPAASPDGLTALQAAARHGDIDIVTLLLKSGADIHDGIGDRTAIMQATEGQHAGVVKLLSDHGAKMGPDIPLETEEVIEMINIMNTGAFDNDNDDDPTLMFQALPLMMNIFNRLSREQQREFFR